MISKATALVLCALFVVCSGEDLCTNGKKDYNEADVDCGQECFNLCDAMKSCDSNYDCVSGVCDAGKCADETFEERFLAASGPSNTNTTGPGSVSGASLNTVSSSFGLIVAFAALALTI
jgi:hypothetical protein